VDAANELSEFLTSRRAKVTPEQAGLRSYGRRQVPGLRREEVASLAGVSVDYYRRRERGDAAGVSEGVLAVLADALQLDDAERAHLFDLAHAATPVASNRGRRASPQQVRPVVQRILESIGSPATVSNMRSDYLTANQLGRALYAPLFSTSWAFLRG
jgi:transcriptional regulator with XRE-family HTH domain